MTNAKTMRSRTTDSRIQHWLDASPGGSNIMAIAKQHIAIQETLQTILPTALGAACEVARAEQNRLLLAVPSAAHAAKLRQLAPSISRALCAQGWNLTEISIRIQADLRQVKAPWQRPKPTAQPLAPSALQAFSELHQDLQPGPLADAVARLLRHHGAPTPDDKR